jgi:hypothetical protein
MLISSTMSVSPASIGVCHSQRRRSTTLRKGLRSFMEISAAPSIPPHRAARGCSYCSSTTTTCLCGLCCCDPRMKQWRPSSAYNSGKKMSCLRPDRGGEFTSSDFNNYYTQTGVQCQLRVSYSPKQNGMVERHNQSVVVMSRSMLNAKGLPGYFWGEVVTTTVYLLNGSPTWAIERMTLFEAWYGRKPVLAHLRTFGCVVHVKNTKPHLKKLD